jgi:hypothetical protein
MGLDVHAYSGLVYEATMTPEEWDASGMWDDHLYAWPGAVESVDYPHSAEPLVAGGVYAFAKHTHPFSYSYGTYNRWREWLCSVFLHVSPQTVWNHPLPFAGRPFVELINFSDCEGIIGSAWAANLAKDFAGGQAKVDGLPGDEWQKEIYAAFRGAFELAADGGAVEFR